MPETLNREGFGTNLCELFPNGEPLGEIVAPWRLLHHLGRLGETFDGYVEEVHIGWSEHGLSAYASNGGDYLACLVHVPMHRCGVRTAGHYGTVALEGDDLGTTASMARRETSARDGVSTLLDFGEKALTLRTTREDYGGTIPAHAFGDGVRAHFSAIAAASAERAIVSPADIGYWRMEAELDSDTVTRNVIATDARGARFSIWDSDTEKLLVREIDGAPADPALAAYQHDPVGEVLDLVPSDEDFQQHWYWDDTHPLLAWGFDDHIQVLATVAPMTETPDATLEELAGGDA